MEEVYCLTSLLPVSSLLTSQNSARSDSSPPPSLGIIMNGLSKDTCQFGCRLLGGEPKSGWRFLIASCIFGSIMLTYFQLIQNQTGHKVQNHNVDIV